MCENIYQNITLFKSLFKGRDDVFAVRWEKSNKSGYMPAYFYDPYRYKLHKMKGGSFQDYTEKSYLPYSNEQIAKHLNGEQLIGIYPLLKDITVLKVNDNSIFRITLNQGFKTGFVNII